MKSKAKPVKGSARTKRFDVGGTVGALAGLGTLAYLMSRKKKGADGEYKPQGKFPSEDGSGTSGSGGTTTKVDDAAQKRALDQSKNPKSNLVPEGADKDVLYESDKALVRTDKNAPPAAKKKPAPPPAAKPKTGQGSSTTTGVDAGIADAKRQAAVKDRAREAAKTLKPGEKGHVGSGESKAYPEQEAKARKAEVRASKYTTPGDPNKKEATLEPSAAVQRAKKAVQGTIDNATKSTVRSDTDKMAERAREVQRRREEEMKSRYKNGGAVKKYAAGGSVSSASKRADGIAQRGKTRGKVC